MSQQHSKHLFELTLLTDQEFKVMKNISPSVEWVETIEDVRGWKVDVQEEPIFLLISQEEPIYFDRMCFIISPSSHIF